MMLCAIYKSNKKLGSYLYLSKKDDFSLIPDRLMQAFGKPEFVMLFNLEGKQKLANADNQEVKEKLESQGFYLQMPKLNDGLFNSLTEIN